jgi:GT2 family glycosyltransferase
MKKADVIICTRNNEDIIGRCLSSVKKQTFRDFNCIVVDDCSYDRTAEIVRNNYPFVKIIQKNVQTGPAASRNIALRQSRAEFVATLDSDVQIDCDWLKNQMDLMEKNSEIGIAGSKIFYSWDKGKINSCGGGMTKLGFGFDMYSGKSDEKIKFSIEPVLYGHSAAMVVRRRMLEEIGDFDETYFYGNEDTDLGWRANIAGWQVVANPDAIAYHDENNTVKKMARRVVFHGTKNRIRSLLKNYSAMSLIKYMPLHLVILLGKTMTANYKSERIRAVAWNILYLKSTLRERSKVQRTRKIDDVKMMHVVISRYFV